MAQGFEVDTAGAITRLLTAKSCQHVLQQLGETDLIICQWLNNYAAEYSPLRGDDWLRKLMREVRAPAPRRARARFGAFVRLAGGHAVLRARTRVRSGQ